METFAIVLCAFALGSLIGGYYGYINGAWDAYYFAREPGNPGGRKAGRLIYRTMRHQFSDIPNPDETTSNG